jgi:hypothetical protein
VIIKSPEASRDTLDFLQTRYRRCLRPGGTYHVTTGSFQISALRYRSYSCKLRIAHSPRQTAYFRAGSNDKISHRTVGKSVVGSIVREATSGKLISKGIDTHGLSQAGLAEALLMKEMHFYANTPYPQSEQPVFESYDPHRPHYSQPANYVQYSHPEHVKIDAAYPHFGELRPDQLHPQFSCDSSAKISASTTTSSAPSRHPSSSPHHRKGSTTARRKQKTRVNVSVACGPCKKSHLACDVTRPCRRCCSLDKAETCEDIPVSLDEASVITPRPPSTWRPGISRAVQRAQASSSLDSVFVCWTWKRLMVA